MAKKSKKQRIKRLVWIKISKGEDLLEAISDFCLKNKIKRGFILAIGALEKAKYSYYGQEEKKYYKNLSKEFVEILNCTGNVSLKEGKPFVHAHLTLADKKGRVFGGHLEKGTIVFAAECALFELEGDLLERKFDRATGLFLWDFSR